MSKSKQRYENSPKMERNEDGKVVVKKGDKKTASMEGVPEHADKMLAMGHKHEKEHLELNQKHEKERHMLRSKHMKEGVPAEEKMESKTVEKAEKEKGVE